MRVFILYDSHYTRNYWIGVFIVLYKPTLSTVGDPRDYPIPKNGSVVYWDKTTSKTQYHERRISSQW